MHQTRDKTDPEKLSVAALYQYHAQMILTYIRPHVNAKEDAEDLLVEVFLAAMQITRNSALVAQRAQKRPLAYQLPLQKRRVLPLPLLLI